MTTSASFSSSSPVTPHITSHTSHRLTSHRNFSPSPSHSSSFRRATSPHLNSFHRTSRLKPLHFISLTHLACHLTLYTPKSRHLSSSHLSSSHLISSHLSSRVSSHIVAAHLISRHPVTPSRLISNHFIASHVSRCSISPRHPIRNQLPSSRRLDESASSTSYFQSNRHSLISILMLGCDASLIVR